MKYAIRVNNLSKHYKDFTLSDVSFELECGAVMGFIGRNGAGKTTTIKLIMGLIHKDSGSIRIMGEEAGADNYKIRDKIGFVYDEPGFYTGMTVKAVEKVTAPYYQKWDKDRFYSLIRKFGLDPDKKTGTLSHGEKTRLSLAIALSHNAELLIMDEPTSGLDPVIRSEFIDILYEIIQDERRSILFSTHITTDLERIADYITLIENGKIIISEPKDALLDKYRIVKGPLERLNNNGREMCIGYRETQTGFEALSSLPEDLAKLVGENAVVEKAKLEDLMVYSVKGVENGR